MARNDYTTRSKRDAFSDIDIDGIIEKHRIDMFVLKVIVIITVIAIVLLLEMVAISGTPKIFGKVIIGIFFAIFALGIALMCTNFIYKLFIKIVVKPIDAIKYYRMRRRKPKALKRVLTFDVPIYSSRNENVTKIEIGDTTATVSHFCYTQSKGGGQPKTTITICQGDCCAVDIKNKLIPNGIWLVNSNYKYIKKGKYSRKSNGFIIYADTVDAINNCYTDDIYAIGKKIYKAVRTYFVLYFENGIMYYIDFKSDNDAFEMDVFDFDIEKLLRRDLAILKDRIEFAKILASA